MVLANALTLSRWQFATTTLYHFTFVPLTLGLAPLLAIMQTLYHRTADEKWNRLVRFFAVLFLINFAIGAATGMVQEFEFGMNWSSFSKYVGDVFGAPLAIEGLGAFMLLRPRDPVAEAASRHDLQVLGPALGLLHHRRELVDAAPGRLRDQQVDGNCAGERHES